MSLNNIPIHVMHENLRIAQEELKKILGRNYQGIVKQLASGHLMMVQGWVNKYGAEATAQGINYAYQKRTQPSTQQIRESIVKSRNIESQAQG